MPLRFACPGCKKVLQAPESKAGQLITCPFCRAGMRAPAAASPPASVNPPPSPTPAPPPVPSPAPVPILMPVDAPEEIPELPMAVPILSKDEPVDHDVPEVARYSDGEREAYLREVLPAEAVAGAFQLGPIKTISDCELTSGSGFSLGCIGALVLVVFFCSGGSLWHAPGWMIGVLLLAVGAIGYEIWGATTEAELMVLRLICRDGIVSRDENHVVTMCRWDEVVGLYTEFVQVQTKLYGVVTTDTKDFEKYTVQREDGDTIDFHSGWPNYKRCKQLLESEINPRMLERSWQSYNAGEGVHFGVLYLSYAGISGDGLLYEWPRISRVEISEGYVFVLDISDQALLRCRVADVANFMVFVAMARSILAQQN